MKKFHLLFACLCLLALSFNTYAQTTTAKDYYVGKWSIQIDGAPGGGDGKIGVTLERKDGKLVGTLLLKVDTDSVKTTKVEENDKSIVLYFKSNDYDVNLTMEKKDEDNITGNVMSMFEAKGVRIKDAATKP